MGHLFAGFGPHGGYIVASYAVAILVFGWMLASSLSSYRAAKAKLAQMESRRGDRA